MKSVQLVAPRTLEPREMPMPPDPGPGEVLVKLRAVGICGSDMHWYLEGGIGPYQAAYPQILGHEPAGEIAAVGKGVDGLVPGQKVAVEPAIHCGHCEHCLAGRINNCLYSQFMGSPQLHGLFREYAVMPAANALPIPDGMGFTEATLAEPLAVMLHVLELTPIRLGETVAVMGAGPVGLLMASVAKLSGASTVFVVDRLPHRLQIACEMGAADAALDINSGAVEAIMDLTRGRGVDIVFDCAAARETLQTALTAARIGGRLVLIGIPSEHRMPIDLNLAMLKELNIQTIKRSNHNAEAAIAMMQSGRISTRLVTHHFPLEQTARGFETLAAYSDGVGKVIIDIP
ncbi:MAG: alcohol dehydrogenase catalytic domain-containing protein [Bryobacteraceae bacterium]